MPKNVEDTPRSRCTQCSGDATCQMELTVRQLSLERRAGIASEAYWLPSYDRTVSQITALLCAECVKRNVTVSIRVDATIERGKKSDRI